MANWDGVNYAKKTAVPSTKAAPGEVNGKIEVAYDEITFTQDAIALNDILRLALRVPAGARIINAVIKSPSLGTTGIMALGTAGDPDALLVSIDAGGQAVLGAPTAAAVDHGKKLTADTDYQIKMTEAADAASGKTVQAWIAYVME